MSESRAAVLALACAIVGIGVGVAIGWFSHPNNQAQPSSVQEDTTVADRLINEMRSENIEQNLWDITRKPHIAGRDTDEVVLVNYIRDKWLASGADAVEVKSYDVLLSYPVQNDSNYVAVVAADGAESDVSQRKELVLDPEQNDPDVVDPFNAYSAAGQPQGEIVYVNYATIEDFIYLNRTLKIDSNGKICIARYGQIFRGDKANHAQQYGCIGLILYSDPADYTVPWAGVYPDDWYLPPTGAQRGTLFLNEGDPRTPNYPSIASAWHMANKSLSLPQIPVTPIGYIDAVKYLEKMGGSEVEAAWRGGLNITYRYGPGLDAIKYSGSQIKMSVRTNNEVRTTSNVIGYIRGSIEPDRYVIIGNHRDAWVFGAMDPSSGTAILLEIVRAYGAMLKQGWRPRRTLMFCSWGAEEYGLIGSTEWVEEMQKELQARTVAYLNVDTAVSGNYSFSAAGVPSLRDAVYDAAKLVPNPDRSEIEEGRSSVYDTWIRRYNDTVDDGSVTPSFGGLGSGSDYAVFITTFGISATDMYYIRDPSTGLQSYPVYHSVYETFELVRKFVDPEFGYHLAVARVLGEVSRKLADSVLLPIDCRLYAADLHQKKLSLYDVYGEKMTEHGVDLAELTSAIATFATTADEIHERLEQLSTSSANLMQVREINDQLMQLERAFIDQNPLPGRIAFRHVISAPSAHNSYGSSGFPSITDSLFDIDADPDQDARWDEVKRQYSIVIFHILSAANTLRPAVPQG